MLQSAGPDPETPAAIILTNTQVYARQPLMRPMKNFAKLTRRSVIPEMFIRSPVSMKNGIASSEKPDIPFIMFCEISVSGAFPVTRRYATAAMPIETNISVPRNISRNIVANISRTFI